MLSILEKQGLRFKYFVFLLLLICLAYLVFEYFFIGGSALSADEFVFARHIYEYTFSIPYRDFPPYKSALGHYLLAIPMFFSQGILAPLYYIKDEIALINALCFLIAGLMAAKFYDKNALLLATLTVMANQLFLIYSVDLRVDMLTGWASLFAIFFMIARQEKWAGIALGISFLISQKALWYFIAIDGAIIISILSFKNPIYNFRSLVKFSFYTTIPIIAYVIFWSMLSNLHDVLYSLFYEAYIQSGINFYLNIYSYCWEITIYHGPLIYLLCPLTFVCLFDKGNTSIQFQQRLFLQCAAAIVLVLFINYKQPFPYNFVFTVPAFFIVYANFFTWLFSEKISLPLFTAKQSIYPIILIVFYISCMTFFLIDLPFRPYDYAIFLAPLLLIYYLSHASKHQLSSPLMVTFLILFIAFGIIKPFQNSWHSAKLVDGSYQRKMLTISDKILQDDAGYIGGVPFLYRNEQPIDGMKNLIGPAIQHLYLPSKEMAVLMLPSLYLTSRTQQQILEDFNKKPVKIILNNYRMLVLPQSIRYFIEENYQHFYGSIYIYSPTIAAGVQQFNLKFAGNYLIESDEKLPIIIDDRSFEAGNKIELVSGQHQAKSTSNFRLTLQPKQKLDLDPKYQEDNWLRMLKAILF